MTFNKDLQDALTQFVQTINSGIDSSSSFLNHQMPDVIHQLLLWNALKSIGRMFISCISFILITFLVVRIWKTRHSQDDSETMGVSKKSPPEIVAAYTCFLYVIPVLTWDADFLQIWLAPKFYLVEYAASIVTK